MERSNTLLKIMNSITFALFIIFVIIASLKLTNHSPTFEQAIIVMSGIIIGHQFYLSKKISKLDGKFEMFEHDFKDLKQEAKDLTKEITTFKEEFIEFKHEIKHELRLLNKNLS